ncbi:MAG: hypothetical protein AAGG53_04440 [Cyanobacteria bacterium P01_H01_bin.152]
MTTLIETSGKHWVSEIESSRLILWRGQWQRVDGGAQALRQEHPERFRPKWSLAAMAINAPSGPSLRPCG